MAALTVGVIQEMVFFFLSFVLPINFEAFVDIISLKRATRIARFFSSGRSVQEILQPWEKSVILTLWRFQEGLRGGTFCLLRLSEMVERIGRWSESPSCSSTAYAIFRTKFFHI